MLGTRERQPPRVTAHAQNDRFRLEAPAAIGPYSQAIRAGNTVYLSGQIPLDPKTMELVKGDVRAQARQVSL